MRLRADQRLFLSYLLLIVLLVAAISAAAESLVRRQLVQSEEDHLRRELELAVSIYEGTPGEPPPELAVRLGELSGRRVTIVAPDGSVLGESTREGGLPGGMPNHGGRPEIREAMESPGAIASAVRFSTTVSEDHMYAARRTRGGDVLRLAVPLAEIDAALARVQRRILLVGAVGLLLAALFSLAFSVAVTRPLRRIRMAANAMAAGDLSRRLRERRRDELGDLARALDALVDELQRRLGPLDDERAEMQTLIDSMAEGVLAVGPGGALRRANPAARLMFALPESVGGVPPEAVSRRPEFLRLVRGALAGETISATELVGEGRSLLGTAHPLPDGGAVLVFLDVSELRRLEGVRRDFVANASHELKTPLTAIRGYSETLLDPELPPELARSFARTVKQNSERLQRIVDDLLDLSRIESGGWAVERETVDVEEAIQEAWAAQPAGPRPELTVDVDPGARTAAADPAALHQILSNLFSNAIRYTPADGSVVVRARPVRMTGGPGVEVAVTDSGTGISAAHLPRIFERFYRADPARSRAEGGTGLGLAIVRHLVEAHGGKVDASSELGRGTTIRFTLPVG